MDKTYLDKMARTLMSVCSSEGCKPSQLTRDGYLDYHAPAGRKKHAISMAGGWAACVAEAERYMQHGAPEKAGEALADELADVARAKRALASTKSENKRLLQYVVDLESALHISDQYNAALGNIPKVRPRDLSSRKRQGTAVVLCSDWHVEERVNPREVNGRNEYTPEIARSRVDRLLEGVLWTVDMWRSRYSISDLVVWLGGDIISGYIHEEFKQTNAMAPAEAALFAQDLIAESFLAPLAARGDFERIIVPCNYGNHGRSSVRPQHKNAAHTSWEWLMYSNLARVFSTAPYEFHVSQGAHHYLDVYDTRLRFHHGDNIRYYGGVGGLTIPMNKAIAQWDNFVKADITCIGHYHTYMPLQHAVVNGSLVGYNEYALAIKAAYEPPQQAIFLVDEERGMRHNSRIWVDSDLSREK